MADAVQIAKDFRLDFELLGGGFDDEVTGREPGAFEHRNDPLKSGNSLFRSDPVLGQFAVQIPGDGFEPSIEKSLFHIAQQHLKAAASENVGNTVAHSPGTDHSYAFDGHENRLSFAPRPASLTPQMLATLRFKVRLRLRKICLQ